MTRVDVHQHLWSEPLVAALEERRQFPFIRRENGLAVLYLAGERPYVIDMSSETAGRRGELVQRDGLDRALICLSSPLGIEWLPREQALKLIGAYHEGALALGEPFGVWGAVALEQPDPADVDRAIGAGCIGISLPAGALASVDAISRLDPVLARLSRAGAPLLVHPGPDSPLHPGPQPPSQASLHDPLWWPAMTSYVASMQAAWMAFLTAGRVRHPDLRVVFSMLAGLAPLQHERLASRGCPTPYLADPHTFYETSSFGAATVGLLAGLVGHSQLLYGSDRPVVDPLELGMPDALDWDAIGAWSELAGDTDRLAGIR
jgi:hypothetical protein